jgi:hypothetical protein
MFSAPDGGKWHFTIKSICEGELSALSTSKSFIVDGTLADPGSADSPIPDGVEDIPRPEGLTVQLGA